MKLKRFEAIKINDDKDDKIFIPLWYVMTTSKHTYWFGFFMDIDYYYFSFIDDNNKINLMNKLIEFLSFKNDLHKSMRCLSDSFISRSITNEEIKQPEFLDIDFCLDLTYEEAISVCCNQNEGGLIWSLKSAKEI